MQLNGKLVDLNQWSSTEDDFAIFGDIFGCHNSGSAAGIWWVEARDLTKYPAMYTAKSYLASNINSAKSEKS